MRDYLLAVTAAAILAALIRALAPAGGTGRGARMGAGLLVILSVMLPLGEIDPLGAAKELMHKHYADPLRTDFLEKTNRELLSELISGEAEAYILDKAQAMGFSPEISVTTKVYDRFPEPWQAEITGSPTAAQKTLLKGIIEKDLAIPEERQVWKIEDR